MTSRTPPSPTDGVEEADRLFKLATPGEWHIALWENVVGICQAGKSNYSHEIIRCVYWSCGESWQPTRKSAQANASAVVALHNAAPALFAAARDAEELHKDVGILLAILDGIEETVDELDPEDLAIIHQVRKDFKARKERAALEPKP